jgi:hypothetical protein
LARRGDPYVSEAATIGSLEDLQNTDLHDGTDPEQFRPYLLPESARCWDELYGFWERVIMAAPYLRARHDCPCCGYPTLHERGGYEICSLCDWEDDGQDDPCADEVWGGPNGEYSLTVARENFRSHLTKYGSPDPRTGGGDSLLERQAKQSMIDAFEQIRSETSSENLDTLWEKVAEARAILDQETGRRIREFEQGLKKELGEDSG